MRYLVGRTFIRIGDTGSITVGTLSKTPAGGREDKLKHIDEDTDVSGFVLEGHPLAVRLFGQEDDLGFVPVQPR